MEKFHTTVLILEDDPNRVNSFRDRLDKEGVKFFVTDSVTACIQALENCEWEWLFLDHDLGGKFYVKSDGDEPTGWHVAKWLSEHPDRIPDAVILHSLNPNGRKNMKSLLPNAEEVPFAWTLVNITGEVSHYPKG